MADIKKAVIEGTDASGGYLTPEILKRKVYELIQNNTVMVPLLENIKLTSDTTYLPRNTKGTTAYWVAETQSITSSTPEWERITLSPKKVAALVPISTELLEDAAVNPSTANYVVEQMGKDLGLALDAEILTGSSNFTGLFDTASYNNVISAGSDTNGAEISLSKFVDAINECEKDNFAPDVSVFNAQTINALRKLTDGNGRPMFDNATFGSPMLKDGALGTIYGTKVYSTNQIPHSLTSGTASDTTEALVGKQKKFGVYGLRRDLNFHKFYEIDNDYWKYQVNMRAAFNTLYKNAYCVILDIWS